MPAPEVTEEKKNDLMAIQMRGGLYADKFFKKGSDTKGLPKYFQVSLPPASNIWHASILLRPVPWWTVLLISTDVFRTKIARRPFSRNSTTTRKWRSTSLLFSSRGSLSHHLFALNRFSKKRYGELKEINRRRLTATKNMKRLKNKKKWACCCCLRK